MPLEPSLLVLISLAGGPKHGHAMMLDIEGISGTRPGPGTLYGAIGRLESNGLIQPLPVEARRRPYRLTPAGESVLRERLAQLRAAVDIGLRRATTNQ
jgi:DNA-binding PadR family transcriptional regulator